MPSKFKTWLAALVREPALLIDAAETAVIMFVALGVDWHGDQQKVIIGLFIAVIGLIKGYLTKPFPVNVIPDFGRAALVFASAFGIIHTTGDQITIIVTFLGTIMTLMSRAQITPRYDAKGVEANMIGSVDWMYVLVITVLAGVLVVSTASLWASALIAGVTGGSLWARARLAGRYESSSRPLES